MPWKNKEAEKAYKKLYYEKTKKGRYERTKHNIYKWREKNTEKFKLLKREYYLDNKEKILEKQKLNYDKANAKSRENTKNLTDGYIKKHLIKLGFTRQQIRKNPKIIETQRLIILIKRELKK